MFKLESKYTPSGDQPSAIDTLVKGIKNNKTHQVLLGATGTGKTFTIANVIEKVNKPTLVLAHNKTLAGQLYSEFKELFPSNKVELFISYYDYFQPEAYLPSTDTYIEKDSSINDEIDELRHSATSSILNRDDVIIVASVSCIYGIGEIEDYQNKVLTLQVGDCIPRNTLLTKLIDMLYERTNVDLVRGSFRVVGDVIEIIPVNQTKEAIRISMFDEEIETITIFDPVTGKGLYQKESLSIFPASHFVTDEEKLKITIKNIKEELEDRLNYYKDKGRHLEYERLEQRCRYDIEMLEETSFCRGIENYSRHLALKEEGQTPTCLMDFFKGNYLLVIDESHVTIPQVRAMYNGDRARKTMLVEHGFRLPSALDNRPLKFDEFNEKLDQVIYVSATPGDYELELVNQNVAQQIIRPTGLLDPNIEVRPSTNQIDDIIGQIHQRIEKNERILITTLTIRMSEELTNYLSSLDIKVAYLHSEIKALQRLKIINDLRIGKYDVLIGINLLREGLDIPEVSLICILDADKEGFLRSDRSLIQTIGRAARNANGQVIMYANKISKAMQLAIDETKRRRTIQEQFNKDNNITPTTIIKSIKETVGNNKKIDTTNANKKLTKEDKLDLINELEIQMKQAAKDYDFEQAALLRDSLFELKGIK